jgi:aspartyl-tRNA(Asn)/glutamyl-tRNA(Gln) amidotransferase subunit A
MCEAALGSDTGGSIRIPAALCGVVGMKPTFGRVSRYGVFPLSATLDHVGPLTRTVADNAVVLAALCGFDARDPGSVRRDAEDFATDLDLGVRGLTLGVPDSHYFDNLDDEVERLVRATIASWEDLGAVAKPVTLPAMDEILAAHRTVVAVEAYATHRVRRDGA